MNILIAPNSFKNSLSAEDAARAIQEGLESSKLSCHCIPFPIADGGDGTAGLLTSKLKGEIIHCDVRDPIGRNIQSFFGLIDEPIMRVKTAIIGMADASGLKLLKKQEYDPLHATSAGTGDLIKYALDQGAERIIVCIGGSATVDGGIGIGIPLGVRFYDGESKMIDHPARLVDLHAIDFSGMDPRMNEVEMVILCDVANNLLGENGAAAVFGPQKGAGPDQVILLDKGLGRLRDIFLKQAGIDLGLIKYGGAAGGVGAGLHAFFNAKLVNGIDYFLDVTGFDNEMEKADIIITGEGSIDVQTLEGKGPFGVAKRARKMGIPVIGIAGQIPIKPNDRLREYFDILIPINNGIVEIERAIKDTYENLYRSAGMIGDFLSMRKTQDK